MNNEEAALWAAFLLLACFTLAHRSARIGEAHSTWADSVISHANVQAAHLGTCPGLALREWLLSAA